MARAIYADRREAGKMLGEKVKRALGDSDNPLVLAIPRGGIVVGSEVAEALGADLDLVIPRKVGAPQNPEFAIGAVIEGDTYLNQDAIRVTGATDAYIEKQKAIETKEASRRLQEYRGNRPPPELTGKVVVVVDDGVATGATMIAALRWVKSRGARLLVAAAPVAPPSVFQDLKEYADLVVCPGTPENFDAIGAFYSSFPQVSDEEVKDTLRERWSKRGKR